MLAESFGRRSTTRLDLKAPSYSGGHSVGDPVRSWRLQRRPRQNLRFRWLFCLFPIVFTTNHTIFVVGSYTFNSAATNDDVSQMWINPSVSSFRTGERPAPTLVSTATSDIGSAVIASFVLFNRNANEPAGIIADEIRVGATWAM